MEKSKMQQINTVSQLEGALHPLKIPDNRRNTHQSTDNSDKESHRLLPQTLQMSDELELHIQELAFSRNHMTNTLDPNLARDDRSCVSTDDEHTRERFLSDDTSDYSTDSDESINEFRDDSHAPYYSRDRPHTNLSEPLDRLEQLQAMEERERQEKEQELSWQREAIRTDTSETEDLAETEWRDFDWSRPLYADIDPPKIVISNERGDNVNGKHSEDESIGNKLDRIVFVSEPEMIEESGSIGVTENQSEVQQRRRPKRGWSLESPEIREDFPNRILVQITGFDFNQSRDADSSAGNNNNKVKTSVRLVLHSVAHHTKPSTTVEGEFQTIFCFPLDYHSLLFDTLKMDVYEHKSLFNSKKRIGRACVRLSELTDAFGKTEYEGAFPIEHNSHPMLHKTIGTIRVKIMFRFPDENPLEEHGRTQKPPILRSRSEPPTTTAIPDGPKDVIKRSVEGAEIATRAVSDVDESEFGNISVRPFKSTSLGILDLVLAQETREAIKEITVLYHAFFDHGWRLTKLEFLRAYLLLEKFYMQATGPKNDAFLSDVDKLHEAHHFYKYAVASYGSFLFNWTGYGSNQAFNAFRLNSDRKVVQEYFKLGKEDLIRWEYGSVTVSKPCFMIVRDPETNAIVVSIRGTINVTDCITDALGHYEPWNGGFVHRGFLKRAQNLVECAVDDIRAAVEKFDSKSIYLTGHSLGASVSSIATMILREQCKDLLERGIEIHAYNFATAPCMSLDLAKRAEEEGAIDTFINENDIIPRLSYGNLMDFKDLVKFAAGELKNEAHKNLSAKKKLDAMLTAIASFLESLRKSSTVRKLYVPGAVYCLQKRPRTQEKSGHASKGKTIVCERSSAEHFAEISLKKKWLFHHFPDRYDRKFKGAIRALTPGAGNGGKGFWRWLKSSSVADDPADLGDDEGGNRMERWMTRSGHV